MISQKNKSEMIKSMLKEIELCQNYLGSSKINSIYFGGGTPSILDNRDLELLFDKLRLTFDFKKDIEISIESNPDDLSLQKLHFFKDIGINRLSIGVQSFCSRELKFLNRGHNSKQALDCIELAKQIGFNNISIDLIYGLPNQNLEQWSGNLEIMFGLEIQHFSAYSLTVEPKTMLHHLVKTKRIIVIDDPIAVEQYNLLTNQAKKNKFIQYEISNFGKKEFFSKHNMAYWQGKKYLGIGPSAHSYNGISRKWNVSNNAKYIKQIHKGKLPFEKETLTDNQKFNEYILTSLRTIWGLDLDFVRKHFDKKLLEYLINRSKKLKDEGKMQKKNGSLQLTKKGKLYADAIVVDLIVV